jgi:DNA mismatch repair ATPase MutS
MLGKFPNSISIITTHFTKLTDLEKTSNFSCYKIPINRDSNGDIEYTYKLEPGVSDQFIALELLGKKGFDRDIVDRAIHLCSDIRKPPEEPIEPVAPEKIPPKPKRVRKTKAKKLVDNEEDKIETEELILKNETEPPKD